MRQSRRPAQAYLILWRSTVQVGAKASVPKAFPGFGPGALFLLRQRLPPAGDNSRNRDILCWRVAHKT